jgi:DNA repair protein RadC
MTAIGLLDRFGSLGSVLSQPPDMLASVPGMGEASSVLVSLVPHIAALAVEPRRGAVLDSASGVKEYLRVRLGLQRRERLVALLLDSSGRLLAEREIERGTVDRASVHPRNLVEKIVALNATAVILVHNHPGGRLEASAEDLSLTSRLQELGRSLGFRVLDHFIATDAGVLSLREKGLMQA